MKVFTTILISLYSATAVFADINLKHIEYFEGTCKILVIEDKELECGENFSVASTKWYRGLVHWGKYSTLFVF